MCCLERTGPGCGESRAREPGVGAVVLPGLRLSQDFADQGWVCQVVSFAEVIGLDGDLEPGLRGFRRHCFSELISGPAGTSAESKAQR